MDARRVCDTLDVPHYVFDMEDSFGEAVIDDFVSEYASGRTPNPCVRCNSNTKIPELLRRARQFGADTVATGHYARLVEHDGAPAIARGHDSRKDQTYFLWALPRGVLPFLEFPVGELTKPEVRARARELGLSTAEKPESQERCFVPTGNYVDVLEERLPGDHPALAGGRVVTPSGEVVGEHDGYARFTVGQRKGLGGGHGRKLYVLGSRPATREVVVGSWDELHREQMSVAEMNWLSIPPRAGERVSVQIRHRALQRGWSLSEWGLVRAEDESAGKPRPRGGRAASASSDEPALAAEATATAGGMPICMSSGVSRKPPPTPNMPERTPTAAPSPRIRNRSCDRPAMGR